MGDVEPGDRFPKSRDDGRCCHDKVPARLRDSVGIVRGDSDPDSCTDPRLDSVVYAGFGSSVDLASPIGSGTGVWTVGSRCSGGSIEDWPMDEALIRKGFRVGEPAMDRARSTIDVLASHGKVGHHGNIARGF